MLTICVFCVGLVFLMLSPLFIAAFRSPAGEGLTFWLLLVVFFCIFVTFLCGVLDQVWYMIASFPDLCCLSYFQLFAYRIFY